MKYQEDFVINKNYLNLINMAIYDVKNDRHGIISEISVRGGWGGSYMAIYAYWDSINSHNLIMIDDFTKGDIKFVFLTGGCWDSDLFKETQNGQLESVKAVLNDKYTDDMVMWIDAEERKTKMSEQTHRLHQYIGGKLVNLDSFAEEVVYESYSTLQAFCLYVDGIIDEKQMLYAMVNTLAAEKRVERDRHIDETHETFSAEIRKHLEENKDFWKEIMKATHNNENEGSNQ